MRFYRVHDGLHLPKIHDLRDEAHRDAKAAFNKFEVSIDEIEVPTDKGTLLALLRQKYDAADAPVLRRWELTPRGGLNEIDVEEEGAS